jgi:thiol:disulfide interchange protein
VESARANQIVLVEFTADWCGNCQYVEAHVLHNPAVVSAVKAHDVLMLKADVTSDDAPARPLLEKLNPAGSIPLTVIYSPGSTKPIELAGIYSKDDLRRAIDAAATRRSVVAASR